jgi:hypothetical protein
MTRLDRIFADQSFRFSPALLRKLITENLARLHLDEIGQKIDKLLGQKDLPIDDTTLAHLKEIRFRIERVLKANLNANEP